MKKTIRLLLILLSSVFLLAGCASAEYIALTDEESDAIAQYCAYLMLKYDKNEVEKRKLLEVKELQDIYKEEKASEEEKKDPEVSVTPTETVPEPTEEPAVTEEPEPTNEPTPTKVPDEDKKKWPNEPEAIPKSKKAKNLSQVFPGSGFEVKFASVTMGTNIEEDEYFTYTPPGDGYTYFQMRFYISNTEGGIIDVNFNDSQMSYVLYCENGDIINGPEIGIKDDLQFFSAKLAKTGSDAVLLFIIRKDASPYLLRITNGSSGKVYDIKLSKK